MAAPSGGAIPSTQPDSSSRLSQARATAHSRFAVAIETPRASAASGKVSPPKKR